MKAILIIAEISIFVLTLASILFCRKAAYKKVNNLSRTGLNIRLKKSAWCTFVNADEVSIKDPPPSMGSKVGLFKSFRGVMLLFMLLTASIAFIVICPSLIYASFTEEISIFEGILGIIIGFGGCAAMILYVSYSLFTELAIRDRIIELHESA